MNRTNFIEKAAGVQQHSGSFLIPPPQKANYSIPSDFPLFSSSIYFLTIGYAANIDVNAHNEKYIDTIRTASTAGVELNVQVITRIISVATVLFITPNTAKIAEFLNTALSDKSNVTASKYR